MVKKKKLPKKKVKHVTNHKHELKKHNHKISAVKLPKIDLFATEEKIKKNKTKPEIDLKKVLSKSHKPKRHFELNKAMSLNDHIFKKPIINSTRQGFGEALVELGKSNENVVVLTADLSESTKVNLFAKEYPKRFFNVGIAEQNMLGMAAGLAFNGKAPFATSFGVFAIGRAWDQLRTSICYAKANVNIAATHNGVSVGIDGATHQMLNDIALTRTLPNLTVISPCDYEQAKRAVFAAEQIIGPVYIRLTRTEFGVCTTPKTPFIVGKADVYVEGRDAYIIATGEMVFESLLAAKKLTDNGISTGVINVHTLKPLDETTLTHACHDVKIVLTAEDHSVIGGLGSAIAELIAEMPEGNKPKQIMIGIKDEFGQSGKPEELMKHHGLTHENMIEQISFAFKKH